MSDEVFLQSITIGDEIYFIQTHFLDDFGCSILLTDTASTWKSELNKSDIVTSAKEIGIALKEYFLQLKAALTGKPFHKV